MLELYRCAVLITEAIDRYVTADYGTPMPEKTFAEVRKRILQLLEDDIIEIGPNYDLPELQEAGALRVSRRDLVRLPSPGEGPAD